MGRDEREERRHPRGGYRDYDDPNTVAVQNDRQLVSYDDLF